MAIPTIHTSTILIINDIDATLQTLKQTLPPHFTRIIRNEEKDEFLIAQANATIKEAYIASNETKYIILCGSSFRKEAQNSLLKVLEEPPKNIVFIIITTSKSTLLPTIISRMPLKYLKKHSVVEPSNIDIAKLDLKEAYAFLKQNQKISKLEAKQLVESLLYKVNMQRIKLSKKELESFSTSIKLLELNTRPIHVITTLMLNLVHLKHKNKS
ncbi:DNA polymerase III subunit delta' [Candidatus Marinarcus aquaticus]|uniref:DNA polymerase III subunit delta n=1 Tax=Candidatus Marinarcus aquaticus TaxID=2044504 RepID=A0A4Q0XSU3_9BACT|nr:DNA polymerase III subunit delta' [Candidatus Marinarcus aquaticus]RXJ60113.1 DNA polymerase III subunit delta' [Candidatus Marinarcus aquaticus]